MAAPTFAEAIRSGVGRVEYVFHVGGVPWAVSTAPLTLSAGWKIDLFGMCDDAGTYPASSMPVIPTLLPPGEQRIRLIEHEASLEDGEWVVEIADAQPGISWTHRGGDIWGLEGLNTSCDPRVDDNVLVAVLDGFLKKADTTITITGDAGSRLSQWCSDVITGGGTALLWIGGECIGLSAISAVAEDWWGTIATTGGGGLDCRGVYKSKKQSFYPDDTDTVFVSNAPIGGLANRPARLWAILVDETGAPIDYPVLIRHGKVSSRVDFDGKYWKVQCLPWWSWLDTTRKCSIPKARIRGHYFSNNANGTPVTYWQFLRITEIGLDASGNAYVLNEERFYPPQYSQAGVNDSYCFFTYEELVQAVTEWLATVSGKMPGLPGLYHEYKWTEEGPKVSVFNSAGAPLTMSVVCDGALAWLYGWGGINDSWTTQLNALRANDMQEEAFGSGDITGNFTPVNTRYRCVLTYNEDDWYSYQDISPGPGTPVTDRREYMGADYRATYAVGWDYCRAMGQGISSDVFPWPQYDAPHTVACDTTIYVAPGVTPSEDFNADNHVYIGGSELYTGDYDTLADCGAMLTLGSNSITIAQYPGPPYPASDDPHLIWANAGDSPEANQKFPLYCVLAWIPAFVDDDPWPIWQTGSATTTLKNILQALITGYDSIVKLPERMCYDHIPDVAFSVGGDHGVSIDWDSLGLMTDIVDDGSWAKWHYEMSEELNLWDAFRGALQFAGVSPTWEWSDEKRQFHMRFRRASVVNSSMAFVSGRSFGEGDYLAGTVADQSRSPDSMLAGIDLNFNYSFSDEKYKSKFKFRAQSGFCATGGKELVQKVSSPLTYVNDVQYQSVMDSVINYFSGILHNYSVPSATNTMSVGMHKLLDSGVGAECIVSDAMTHDLDGRIGITDRAGLVIGVTTNLADARLAVEVRLAPNTSYGWAPSMRATGSQIVDADNVRLTIITDNAFSGTGVSAGWLDLWFFDCLDYNTSMDGPAVRGCSCADYRVTVFEEANKDGLIWEDVTITQVNTVAKTALLYKTGIGLTWDIAKSYVIVYADWNNANLQACQRRWIYIANDDGELIDASAVATVGMKWVG